MAFLQSTLLIGFVYFVCRLVFQKEYNVLETESLSSGKSVRTYSVRSEERVYLSNWIEVSAFCNESN
jgi:hypothetical protein